LFIAFVALILMSAFFSSSETGLMSLNRYRLRHLADKNHGGAIRAVELLKRPDKLITLILLGNNFINVLITQLATYIGYRLYGEAGIAIAAGDCRRRADAGVTAVRRGHAENAGGDQS
jgi:Mg2+/Co2+ transporter CorB